MPESVMPEENEDMDHKKEFHCLRCEHRFMADHDPKHIVERSCPGCGSNSVRLAPPPPAGHDDRPRSADTRDAGSTQAATS